VKTEDRQGLGGKALLTADQLPGYRWRRVKDRTVSVLAIATVIAVLYPLGHILATFVYQGAFQFRFRV